MMPTPTQIYAYSWIIGNQTDGAQGTLYAGHNRLPLPILDSSPTLQQRIAFAMLLHAFGDEPHAERKASLTPNFDSNEHTELHPMTQSTSVLQHVSSCTSHFDELIGEIFATE